MEVKVRADHEAVRAELAESDAEPLGAVEQVDTYYDAPDRDFAETDEALRIRRETVVAPEPDEYGGETDPGEPEPTAETETTKVTYKGPLVETESKTREEYETAVADGEALAGVLDGLGYEPAATVEKHRERFALDDYVVTLDTVTDLGTFVEVERETTRDRVTAVRDGARELLDRLGLDPDEQIRTSYLGLLLDGT
ncbi:class IV adenylate cyclase [Halobaculum sp. MBLA0147]|uniref:class IV adenylate cyclase n=1 Tax=Halobaculum sp. MBLA0147 TaxID=3079934 RepID=UPI003524968D